MSILDLIGKDKVIKITCEGSTTVSLDELKELQTYKDLTNEAYTRAKNSILRLGFSFPVFMWEDRTGTKWIIDAHQRKRVLMKMRSEEGYFVPPLPAVRIFAKDKKEAKEKILAQESQYGDITQEGLYEFMNEEGFELDEKELETFVDIDEFSWEQEASEVTEDEAPQASSEPAKSELGKVYQLGRHRLMCGDATKIEDVERLMNGQKADMVFTDPPYGVEYKSHRKPEEIRFEMIENDDKMLIDWIPNALMFSTGWFLFSTSWKVVDKWIEIGKQVDKLTNMIIWDKGGGGIGDLSTTLSTDFEIILAYNRGNPIVGKRIGTVWNVNRDGGASYLHPTQKPVALPALAIKTFSEGGVLDLFGGSGSTLIACEQTNRTCYMMELDKKYIDVIRKRYAKYVHPDRWEAEWESLTPSVES